MSNERPTINANDWARFAISRSPDELGELTPDEQAKKLEVERQAVFGVNYKTDSKGRPIENSMSYKGNSVHEYWLKKERLEKDRALKDLLASIKPSPTGA